MLLKFLFRRTRDARRLAAIDVAVARIGHGVFKRQDENRELLQLLQLKCPHLVRDYPWVEGWLKAHDDFFAELAKLQPAGGEGAVRAPVVDVRAWPGRPLLGEPTEQPAAWPGLAAGGRL